MRKQVLFVDDDPSILEGLRYRLHRQRAKWDMQFIDSGWAALEILAREPIDVIVSDMCMPEMDGATFLKKAQELCPRAVRIMLSGQSEIAAAMRAAPVVHQFLCKPCEPGVIENAVERACSLQSLINQEVVQSMVGRIDNLPPSPRVYSQLTAALAGEVASIDDVACILRQDMAMCAKTLQLVNSAFFRLPRIVSRIEEAVTYLGFNTIKQIVLTVEVFQYSSKRPQPRISLDTLQAHALLVGNIASRLFADKRAKEDAFVAGLLHDIGKLVLAVELPDHLDKILSEMKSQGCSMYQAEQAVCGMTHADVGGYILGLWGLPYPVVEAVANHHAPSRVDAKEFGLLAATHIANALANEVECSATAGADPKVSTLDLAYIEAIGVGGRLSEWHEIACQQATTEPAICRI